MSKLLKTAFERIERQFSESEQDEIARTLLRMIEEDDRRWETAFGQTVDKLEQLANSALQEYRDGRTEILDPEKL